jgi:PAS domain S-box-containing protein
MGALIRCHDWSTTPLGTLESWPLSLKTAVSLILRAQQPMFISWGPSYISLYNDGYIPILGDKHPDALGHPMADVWSEIWDELRPLNEIVMRGESLSFENKPFQLAARETQGPHYFSFTYTPLLDDDGQVAGIFCVAIETTSTVKLADNARAASAAQQALAESEERLRLATDASEIAFWDVNVPEGSMIWQPRLRSMFGITTDEPLSLDDFYAGLHPDDRAEVARAFAAACDPQQRALYNVEYRAVGRDDGQVRWIAAKGRGLFDDTGRCARANGTAMDITSRKTTELALEIALEASHTGTFHWNIQDNRLTWDDALDRLFGLRPGEAVRSLDQFIALVHPDDRAEVIRRCERCRDRGDDFEMEFRVVYPDGSMHWLYDRGRTFLDATGRAKTMTGACVDITEYVRAREALKLADRQKDDFLATLAHELRNPLAPLRTGLHLLQNTKGGPSSHTEQVLGIMQRQLDHMVHLIDDLLDVARIRQGKVLLRQEPLSLHSVLEQALESVQPLLQAQDHEVVWDGVNPALRVSGDPTRLVQVMGNLLNNAAKYTPRGGRVTLRGSEATQPDMLLIEVSDTGIGIPPDMLEHVFDRFAQVHQAHAQGGLGIGLSVVKSLVEMHGGRIVAESAGAGAGSLFRIWLPRADTLETVEVAASSDPGAIERHRVLIVDDNRDAAETMAMVLDMGGHEVLLAYDGQTAIEMVKRHDPAVVFLDIGMPGMNGYETAAVLRALPGAQARLLVALTGWGSAADQARSLEAGFDHHLTKPVDIGKVQHVLSARFSHAVHASAP